MTSFTIGSNWIKLDPQHRLAASFWSEVIETMKAAGVDPDTATDADVSAAIDVASRLDGAF